MKNNKKYFIVWTNADGDIFNLRMPKKKLAKEMFDNITLREDGTVGCWGKITRKGKVVYEDTTPKSCPDFIDLEDMDYTVTPTNFTKSQTLEESLNTWLTLED